MSKYAQEGSSESEQKYTRPIHLFIVFLCAIFIFEFLLMLLFSYLPPVTLISQALFDSLLLTLLTTFLIYYVVIGPMLRNVNELKAARKELNSAHEELEDRVEERTKNLQEANWKLEKEFEEHKKTETALSKSEGQFKSLSRQFNTLLDAIPDSILLLTPDLHVLWANKSSIYLRGDENQDYSGLHCYEMWQKNARYCDGCPPARSFKTGDIVQETISSEDGRIIGRVQWRPKL